MMFKKTCANCGWGDGWNCSNCNSWEQETAAIGTTAGQRAGEDVAGFGPNQIGNILAHGLPTGQKCIDGNLWTPDGGVLVDHYLGTHAALEIVCHKAARPDLFPILEAALKEIRLETKQYHCAGNHNPV